MWLIDRLLALLFCYCYTYVRPLIKCFLHSFTRCNELQRICYGAKGGASRTRQVEHSLRLSKNTDIQALLRELDSAVEHCSVEEMLQFPTRACSVVLRAKRIKPRIHPDFADLFGMCVLQIWSYRRLEYVVEALRSEPYNAQNLDHEQKLLQLWQCLMPEPLDCRISKQWQTIGFQGDDPKTDFRGMGLLGLENLLYFAHEYNEDAQHVLLHSRHPKLGYTFAIVGINLTAMAYRLLKSGSAKTHFYNVAQATKQPCSLTQFHRFYSCLLFEFDRFWLESKPTDIMDFREIYQMFEIKIIEALQNNSTVFKMNVVVEDI